jgi:hypothetical protein
MCHKFGTPFKKLTLKHGHSPKGKWMVTLEWFVDATPLVIPKQSRSWVKQTTTCVCLRVALTWPSSYHHIHWANIIQICTLPMECLEVMPPNIHAQLWLVIVIDIGLTTSQLVHGHLLDPKVLKSTYRYLWICIPNWSTATNPMLMLPNNFNVTYALLKRLP